MNKVSIAQLITQNQYFFALLFNKLNKFSGFFNKKGDNVQVIALKNYFFIKLYP